MTDYGKGAALGAATALPATSAAAMMLSEKAHPVIVYGLLAVSVVSLVYLVGSMIRYFVNRK